MWLFHSKQWTVGGNPEEGGHVLGEKRLNLFSWQNITGGRSPSHLTLRIISEGIETLRNHYYNFREEKFKSHVVDILCYLCNNLYLPLSIKEIGHAVDGFDNKLWEHIENGEREFNIHYNGTVEHFNENCVISMPLTYGPSELYSDEVLKINCLDGYVNLNLYLEFIEEI